MRKKMKVFLLICGIVVGIGVIFSVAGLAAGGIQGLARIQEKVPWISFGPEKMQSQSYECQPFSSVDLSSGAVDVRFAESDSWRVEVLYAQRRGAPSVEVKNQTLIIKPSAENGKQVYLSFYNGSDEDESITIYYPQGTKFDQIKADSDMGDITLGNVAAQSVQIETNAGDVELSEITADTFRLVSDMGDVNGTALSTKAADIQTNAGELELSGTFSGTTNISCDMGDCTFSTQLSKETYTIEADADAGDCEVDGLEANGSYRVENPGAKNHLVARTNAGDLELHFQ